MEGWIDRWLYGNVTGILKIIKDGIRVVMKERGFVTGSNYSFTFVLFQFFF